MANVSDTTRVLVIDNDLDTSDVVCRVLEREGYLVRRVNRGDHGLAIAKDYRPDMVVVDTTLPDMNGFELCIRLRTMPFVDYVPVLFLSTHENPQYIARALDVGGDDYLRKPFVARELSARARALLRRSKRRTIKAGTTLQINADQNTVVVDGRPVELTPTEFQLFDYLCRFQSNTHTASSLLENLWCYPPGAGDTALVRNHIRNLRRKIEQDPDRPSIIVSSHGRGYTVRAEIQN